MTHESHLALGMIARLAGRFGPKSRIAKELPDWLEHLAGVDCPERTRPDTAWWNRIRKMSKDLVPKAGGGEGEILHRNCNLLGAHFNLSPAEIGVLAFLAFYKVFDEIDHVVDSALMTKDVSLTSLMSWFADVPETETRAAMRPSGRLVTSGLIKPERRRTRSHVPFELSERLLATMLSDVQSIDDLIDLMLPKASAPDAEWRDFNGMGRDADIIRDIVTNALAGQVAGVNILLYGPPGTGKTEFAKVIACEVGAELRAMGETDVEGGEPSRHDRTSDIIMAGKMIGPRSDTIFLFDEMEDLLGGTGLLGAAPSKLFNNRMLETNPIPVIWTTNRVNLFDPAFLRRITYSAFLRSHSIGVRTRIWQRLEARHSVGISETDLPTLVARHDQAPALVSDAMRVARLCDGGAEMVSHVLDAAARLENEGAELHAGRQSTASWRSELANADMDLGLIEARMSAPDAPKQVSFCLDGPAGTGKSAWARYLADRIGMPVMEKRASDLFSKWVGETEKNIARAFADARADGAFLIFDEADSLLADRRNAHNRWEVGQVNEMLTWMEDHPLPFACTTNLSEKLDPATQRRFTFRIRFDHLSRDQLSLAWAAHFPAPVPDGLSHLGGLSSGDFANVARRMSVMGQGSSTEILHELRREAEAKETVRYPIGFGR